MAANVGGASVSPMKSVLRSCLCGVVTYEISEPFLSFVHCHCSRCRKATGSAHATNLRVPAGQFTWTSGQEKSVRFDLPEAQSFATTFCSCCGSPLPHLTRSGRSVIVPAGSLDGEPSESHRVDLSATLSGTLVQAGAVASRTYLGSPRQHSEMSTDDPTRKWSGVPHRRIAR